MPPNYTNPLKRNGLTSARNLNLLQREEIVTTAEDSIRRIGIEVIVIIEERFVETIVIVEDAVVEDVMVTVREVELDAEAVEIEEDVDMAVDAEWSVAEEEELIDVLVELDVVVEGEKVLVRDRVEASLPLHQLQLLRRHRHPVDLRHRQHPRRKRGHPPLSLQHVHCKELGDRELRLPQHLNLLLLWLERIRIQVMLNLWLLQFQSHLLKRNRK